MMWRAYLYRYRLGLFPSPYGVSFILILVKNDAFGGYYLESFRLLTEYHSFLFTQNSSCSMLLGSRVSVSLRSIIHSYEHRILWIQPRAVTGFRLLTEYHSFLSYGQKSLLLQYVFRMLSCDIFIFEIFLFISVKSIFNSSFFTYRLTNIFL